MKPDIQNETCSFIQTYSGKRIDFENPDPDQIDIVDIAHGLSNLCRFSGQSKYFYSVAQHSFYVSLVCKENKLQALLHDATEAYMADVPGPLKHLCPNYKIYEKKMWKAICQKFNIPFEMSDELKTADFRMLITEKQVLFKDKIDWGSMEMFKHYKSIKIEHMSEIEAHATFLARYNQLRG